MLWRSLGALASVAAISGCASIVGGSSQVVSIQTTQGGDELAGAACKLENDKGTWFVKTPGTVTVHRAYDDLSIKCEKDGVEPGIATVKSSTKGMAFGNILFGGIIGAGVDMGTGAAYDYPPLITVSMGLKTIIGPKDGKKPDSAPVAPDAPAAAPAAASGAQTATAQTAQATTTTAK